jgi:hypothetical protein
MNNITDKRDLKKYNQIPYRIEVIEGMTRDKVIDSLVDFKNDTISSDNNIISNSEDIRDWMPKKYIDFVKPLKILGGKLLYIKSGSTGHTFKGVLPSPK